MNQIVNYPVALKMHLVPWSLDEVSVADMEEWICRRSGDDMNFFWMNLQPYRPMWELQQRLHQRIVKGQLSDVILLLEHPHVYTLGKNADRNHLLSTHPREADVVQIDRGGDITYHGPGQLVGYPIVDLHRYKMSVSWYMRTLEQTIINVLEDLGISASRKEGLTGVWVEDEKICAMGVRLSRWVTMHGFALNLAPDMHFFDGMIPCGIFEFGVTSIHDQIRNEVSMEELARRVAQALKEQFQSAMTVYREE